VLLLEAGRIQAILDGYAPASALLGLFPPLI
jgi:hypothetical protein